ncbi:MAG: DUF368 domain-containing protein [Acidimicrobiaceae bacterium]|nr:DUF368 domain-containing protein [Acidimicrobiaceae bacterium]MXW74924.1 DUF368 domain-containing protein [Acidimicrobiaceae bacterium]MYC42863.1 DUF368 domain-containing protein [Acidimicrobiaceae bacterium]MYI58927.1 DUF368 domain-containing protein [Acidimicrobiaceae bacterium]
MPLRRLGRFVGCGLLMGAADVVPGVSGGTVALVLGIYQRLIEAIRKAAKTLVPLAKGDLRGFWAALKSLDFIFLVPLGIGIVLAVGALAGPIETQLHDHPEEMAGLFFGLVAASIVVALRLINQPTLVHYQLMAAVGAVVFILLGFQSGPVQDPSLAVLVGAGALAVCAMILPGISGSFILLMIGMYSAVIGAVSDRDFVDILFVALGAAIGLAVFSSALGWIMDRYGDLVTAAMIGLMLGSLRVLWPWPNGVGVISEHRTEVIDGTGLSWPASGDLPAPAILAVVGALVVIGLAKAAESLAAKERS